MYTSIKAPSFEGEGLAVALNPILRSRRPSLIMYLLYHMNRELSTTKSASLQNNLKRFQSVAYMSHYHGRPYTLRGGVRVGVGPT